MGTASSSKCAVFTGHAGVGDKLESTIHSNGCLLGIPDCSLTHESETPECTGRARADCPSPITGAVAIPASAACCQTQTAAGASENDSCRALEAESR